MKTSLLLLPRPDDHTLGPKSASIVVVEYADFQCPYCMDAERALRPLREAYEQDMLFVFRHFPLTDVHEWAELAAQAAEAAAIQGKFWEMHAALFKLAGDLEPKSILNTAESLGLDSRAFSRDLVGNRCRTRVKEDADSAEKLRLGGTPTLFIDGQLYDGPWEFASLSRAIAGLLGQRAA